MNLSSDDLRAAYYCVAEVLRRRQLVGQPIPEWMRRHFDRLDAAVRGLSRSGHQAAGAVEQLPHSGPTSRSLISAHEAAQILGISKRQVQQLAADLDGQIIGGRWLFERETVETYAEGQRYA
jgi:excisionase family DNA binding protein